MNIRTMIQAKLLSGTGTEFTVRPYNTQELEDQLNKVREQRNQILKESDWTQIGDYNLGLTNKEEQASYRQKLEICQLLDRILLVFLIQTFPESIFINKIINNIRI